MTRVNACGIVLTLVVLTLIDINFTVLSGETPITDAGVGLWTVLEASAMVQAWLKMARVMRDVTDRASPTSVTLTLEANVHRKTVSSVLARQRETVVDTEHFKGLE